MVSRAIFVIPGVALKATPAAAGCERFVRAHASRKPPEPPRCIHHYSSEIVPDAYPAVLAVERRRDWTQRPGPGTDTDREEGSHAQRRGKFELAPNP